MLVLQNTETVLMILGATMCVLLLFIFLWMGRNNRLLQKNLEIHKNQYTSLVTSMELLAETTKKFENEHRKLQSDLVVKDLYSAGSGSYEQAINAAKSGTTSSEIMGNYGLNSSEAELLLSIHGNRKAVV